MQRLLKAWCHAPWHAWLKDKPDWLKLFAELWAHIPQSAVKTVLSSNRPLVVLPPVFQSHVVRLQQPLPFGAHVLQLDSSLLGRPQNEALAILAHEIAHLVLPATYDDKTNDLAADKLVVEWGMGEGLANALAKDLEETHPRRAWLTQAA